MKSLFKRTQELKTELDSLQPIAPEQEQRLWQKLRLEWNYHSNHIEGNTLTYGETELLLLHDQTLGNHTLREYLEMKAHDLGIQHLRKLAEDSGNPIKVSDIRDLNKIILKEPYWKPTRTPDGQPSRAQVIPGEYKTHPNSVITATGELFEYAAPMDVPGKMQGLIDWLNGSLAENQIHLISVAAKLHHDFVLIHPFDDGNGRVARMLVNYLFLRAGYPPIIVPTEQKTEYLANLRLADAGDIDGLEKFFARQLERSLDLAIRAARGESIKEPSDAEKQVVIFVREQKNRETGNLLSQDTVDRVVEESVIPLFRSLQKKLSSLSELFERVIVSFQDSKGKIHHPPIRGNLRDFQIKKAEPYQSIRFNFEFIRFHEKAPIRFNYSTSLVCSFEKDSYVLIHHGTQILEKNYSQMLIAKEIDEVTSSVLEATLRAIQGLANP
jgi:Fic family protein